MFANLLNPTRRRIAMAFLGGIAGSVQTGRRLLLLPIFASLLVCLAQTPADAQTVKDRVRIARSLVNLTLYIDHHHGIGTVRLARKKGWPKSVRLVFNHFPMLERLALDNGHGKIDLAKPDVEKLGFSSESFTYLVPSRFLSSSDQYIEVSWIDAYR